DLKLAAALWPYWMVRGHVQEARRRFERALIADERPTTARARALAAAAHLTAVAASGTAADLEAARGHAEEALRIYMSVDDPWGVAFSRWVLGSLAASERDWANARDLIDESLLGFRQLGDDHYILAGDMRRAFICEKLGEYARARTLHDKNLRRARSCGNERVEALTLGALAMYAVADGRLEEAWAMV